MKNTIYLLALAFSFMINPLNAQDTIPNYSFENWINPITPKNWETPNLLLPPGFIVCNQTNNSYEGEYAIQLKSIDMEGTVIPGVATLGTIGIGFATGGLPFTLKPLSLSGYVRHPSFGDQVMIAVEFFKEGVEIGDGVWITTDSISDYTQFNIPINYSLPVTPDTMNIIMLTDAYVAGSSLTVDALMFEYPATSVNYSEFDDRVQFYPNPVRSEIIIKNNLGDKIQVSIYDVTGRLILEEAMNAPSKLIRLDGLKQGQYIIRFNNEQIDKREILIKT